MGVSPTDYRERIYERYASTLGGVADEGLRDPYFGWLVSHLPNRDARVLDIGAGAGGFVAYLAERGYHNVRGIDASPEQVELARKRGAPVEVGDVMETLQETASESYDVLVALDVIEHFSKSEAFALLGELHRVLAPAGRCLIHTVNADSPFFGTIRYGDFTHETAFNRGSMTQVLQTHGFSRVQCYEDRPIVHGFKSLARAAVWELARNVATVVLAAETGVLSRDRILTQNFLTVAIK